MKNPLRRIERSITLRLSLGILMVVIVVFATALGFLFIRSRALVKQEAINRATRALAGTALRVEGYLNEVEDATNNTEWLILQHTVPDSLPHYTHRIVQLNPNIKGSVITMEPNYFPQQGRNFSAYSVRLADTVATTINTQHEYYSLSWYKVPRQRNESCWVDPFIDTHEGEFSSDELVTSYCKPLHNEKGQFIGVISTGLSLQWLSKIITEKKPYPHSYCIMLGTDGTYYVHPDPSKLYHQTIFTAISAHLNPDIVSLGHEMMSAKTGHLRVHIEGEPSLVFYQPIAQTGWSIALVCPESDIFSSYTRLIYILIPLIVIGLILLLIVCKKIISHQLRPLDQLAQLTHNIALRHYDQRIPHTIRLDMVGQLQNSFASMQESIDQHISHLHQMNEQTEERNRELVTASQLAQEADQQKNAFLQDVSHQIRTPLNIIVGFMQVLRDTFPLLSPEELDSFTDTMKQNSTTVLRMVQMFFDISRIGDILKLELTDVVNINEIARKALQGFHDKLPHDVPIRFHTSLPDTATVHTNGTYLHRTLRELLFNEKKFAAQSDISFIVETTPSTESEQRLRFILQDTGKGIPANEREHIFEPFIKLDYYSEGLGLGLGLSRQAAQLLGGTLTLDPTYTQGARFILEIPLR
ncbi:MAG: sensor histidine kinase [Bacteroidaceae bacterium]|nr:sensor histidine kinase [Bacteroidaceae bacterium]